MTTLLVRGAPLVGTFHAAGASTSYRVFKPILARAIRNIDVKVVVSKDALELVQSHLGGDYRVLFNGVDIATIARRSHDPGDRADDLLLRPARGAQGSRRAAGGIQQAARAMPGLWIASDGPDGPALRAKYADDHRITWLGTDRRRREVRPSPRARRCSAPRRCTASRSVWCSSRRWPPARPSSRAGSPGTATSPRTASTRCSSNRATPTRWRARSPSAHRQRARRPAPRGRCRSAPRTSRWRSSPTSTSRSTANSIDARRRR